MRILRVAIGMLVSLVLLLLFIGFFLPVEYDVARTARVQGSCEAAFELAADLERYRSFLPWVEQDPTVRIDVGEPSKGEGAHFRWTSEHTGSGAYVVRELEPHARIRSEVDFGDHGKSEVYFAFEGEGDACEVTWGFRGRGEGPRPVAGWFATLMDAMVGRDFERGLAEIASIVENEDS